MLAAALRELAREAVRRQTGARGLRALLENIMLDVMYEAPRRKHAGRCVIGDDVVRGHEATVSEPRADAKPLDQAG